MAPSRFNMKIAAVVILAVVALVYLLIPAEAKKEGKKGPLVTDHVSWHFVQGSKAFLILGYVFYKVKIWQQVSLQPYILF